MQEVGILSWSTCTGERPVSYVYGVVESVSRIVSMLSCEFSNLLVPVFRSSMNDIKMK